MEVNYIGPIVTSNCLIPVSTCETGTTRHTKGLDAKVEQGLIWCEGAEGFGLWFLWLYLIFESFLPNCPNECPSTQKTGITQLNYQMILDGRKVRPHLIWNVELKTLDYFRCVLSHDLGIWVQFPQIYLMPKYPKTAILFLW